jgi:hypothetical protein
VNAAGGDNRRVIAAVANRLAYRRSGGLLNFVVLKAIFKALKGVWVGWGKLDRTASVTYRA